MAHRRTSVVLVLLILVRVTAPAPASAEPFTLERALHIARDSNAETLAARQELEIARGRLMEAEYPIRFNPEIAGEAGRRRLAAGDSGSDFGVAVSQEVEVGGQRAKRIEEARAYLARAEQLVRDRVRLIEAKVKLAFFDALAWRGRHDLLRRIEALNRRVRDASNARVDAGESPAMEANLAEIRLGQSRKETVAAERNYALAILELKRLLGGAPDATPEPSGDLRAVAVTHVLADLIARARQARPDLLANEREVARVDADTALTRRRVIPNPTFEAFYREEAADHGSERIAGAGVRIPIPVFDRHQGELVALAGRRRQAQLEVDAAAGQVEAEVAGAFHAYEAARREVEIFEQDILARTEENFHFIEGAYRAGKIDFFQFVLIQNDLVGAQLSYLDSLLQFREAEVGLERAVGAPL